MSEALFADFAPSTYEEWIEATRASLRGGAIESLTQRSYEGIEIDPLPHADDLAGIDHHHSLPGQFPFVRGTKAAGYRARPWLIAAELDISDPRAFNAALREGLANGLTAITIPDQLSLADAADLRLALADVDLARHPLIIHSGARAPEVFNLLDTAFGDDALSQLQGCIGYDPLSQCATAGAMPVDAFDRLTAHVQTVAERSPQLGSIGISTATYHDAGANAVQELALAIATGVAYLRELNQPGLAVQYDIARMHSPKLQHRREFLHRNRQVPRRQAAMGKCAARIGRGKRSAEHENPRAQRKAKQVAPRRSRQLAAPHNRSAICCYRRRR